jgi:hypothetical protein
MAVAPPKSYQGTPNLSTGSFTNKNATIVPYPNQQFIQPGQVSALDQPRVVREPNGNLLLTKEERPYLVVPDNTPVKVIALIIVFFVGLALIGLLYLILRSEPLGSIGPQQPKDAWQACPIGYCATNIYTGMKRCPQIDATITANVNYEVCNPATSCTDPTTPYAVQSDGSVKSNGLCPEGTVCPCVREVQCADYITSYFTAFNGDPYIPTLSGTQITFLQQNVYDTVTASNQVTQSTQPPLMLPSSVNSFCSIPVSWLPFSTPGCNFSDKMDKEALATCMSMTPPVTPCLQGTLALLPPDVNTFTVEQIPQIGVACVQGVPCDNSQNNHLALWDNQSRQVVCYQI